MLGKNRVHARHEVQKFGNLGDEANRIAYVEAMLLDRVLPSPDTKRYPLERALAQMDRGTMHEVVATFTELAKADCEQAAIMVEWFKRR